MTYSGTIPDNISSYGRCYCYHEYRGQLAVHDGAMAIVQTQGKREPRTISSQYLVKEVPPRDMGEIRVFYVAKNDDNGREALKEGQPALARIGSVYECCVAADHTTCSCPAGQHGHRCLHAEALAGLVEQQAGYPEPVPFIETEGAADAIA